VFDADILREQSHATECSRRTCHCNTGEIMTENVTAERLSELTAAGAPVLVDFWAEWCGPCRQMAPVVDQVAQELSGTVSVVKLNVDDEPAAAAQFGIVGIPTLMLFKGGDPVAAWTGARNRTQLMRDIQNAL
jgi:thioredoxin 1